MIVTALVALSLAIVRTRQLWGGIWGYIAFAATMAIVSHVLVKRFVLACLGGAALSPILCMIFEAWITGSAIKPGWALPMFVLGGIIALPVFLFVGWLFVIFRDE